MEEFDFLLNNIFQPFLDSVELGHIAGAGISVYIIKMLRNVSKATANYKEHFLMICKNTIYNENMPLLERMEASYSYLQNGGNGNTQKYINTNIVKNNEELWNSVGNAHKMRERKKGIFARTFEGLKSAFSRNTTK